LGVVRHPVVQLALHVALFVGARQIVTRWPATLGESAYRRSVLLFEEAWTDRNLPRQGEGE
jgi:hypothetical protein